MHSIRIALLIAMLAGSAMLLALGLSVGGRSNPLPVPQQVDPRIQPGSEEVQPHAAENSQTTCSLAGQFPKKILTWCDLIEKNAASTGLAPVLIAAVMLEESGGDPLAYSKDGAVGLLQVMPRDGLAGQFICPNGPCFAARPSIVELQDPRFNLQYGAQMLAGLIRKFGSVREGLRAYGPTGVGYAYADAVLSIQTAAQ